jgi:lipopolysaccharide transport system permease protein
MAGLSIGRVSSPAPPVGRLDLLLALSRADLRARYGRGRFRLAKWLLDPFALVGVYLVLVTVVLRRGGPAAGLSLACAVVPFQLMMMTVGNSLDAVQSRVSIIANMRVSRSLLPVASAITEMVAFLANLSLLGLMMAIYGVAPTATLVWLPVILAINFALAVALAYPASLLGLSLPELRPAAISLVRALFFLAPGLVSLNQITGTTNDLVRLNPLTGLVEAYRDVFLRGQSPAAWELLLPLALSAVLAGVFVPLYRREQRHFAKVLR